ncbi:MAG: universal stress protein family [Hydrocarboniphaga sp.]|uniref:universal stress protein n=1 Tax=Hydrocarboniphaga sp. TaxID=2033016 RepID=UPI00262663CF|nr:universal stress protein [Hydrocarboniphaga sp.]MDB5971344.1 universal stress protein family [Hydrocarboniphaga sp.]
MNSYTRIFLIADASMRRTPALDCAARLAKEGGAALHIAIFDRDPLITAAALFDKERSDRARQSWMDERRNWLLAQAERLSLDGIQVSSEIVWARPVQDEILLNIDDHSPDLVIKDVHYESHLRRVLFTPLDWQLLRCCPLPLLLVNGLANAAPRRIIAAVDAGFDASQQSELNHRVIREAQALAIRSGAELHLVYAFVGPLVMIDPMGVGATSVAEIYNALLPIHRDNFDALAEAHSVPAQRRHFLSGAAAQTIAEFTQADHSDVLVIGSVRHGLIDRMLMGTTAEAILDKASCNVLAVKP